MSSCSTCGEPTAWGVLCRFCLKAFIEGGVLAVLASEGLRWFLRS